MRNMPLWILAFCACLYVGSSCSKPVQADDRNNDRIVRALEKIADSVGKCR